MLFPPALWSLGQRNTSGSAQLLWMLSSLQLLSLSCFALPGASWLLCILRGLKEGETPWPRALPLPVAPCTNAPPMKCYTMACPQGCHAQPMLLESRDEHGMGTCNASFRQAGRQPPVPLQLALSFQSVLIGANIAVIIGADIALSK